MTPESIERIRKAYYEAYRGPGIGRKIVITEDDRVFIEKRVINYKKWIPQIILDLIRGTGGIK